MISVHTRQRRHRLELTRADSLEALASHRRSDRLLIHAPTVTSQFRCDSGCPIDIVRIGVNSTDLRVEVSLRPRPLRRTCRPSFHPRIEPGLRDVEEPGHAANRVVRLLRCHQFELLLFRGFDAKKAALDSNRQGNTSGFRVVRSCWASSGVRKLKHFRGRVLSS